jgi:hypothetical protein
VRADDRIKQNDRHILLKGHWAMSGKQLQLVEGGQQWQAYGLALIRQELELQMVTRTQFL